jgi:hypothetical protein
MLFAFQEEGDFVLFCVWMYYALSLAFKKTENRRKGEEKKQGQKKEDRRYRIGTDFELERLGPILASCVTLTILFNLLDSLFSYHWNEYSYKFVLGKGYMA